MLPFYSSQTGLFDKDYLNVVYLIESVKSNAFQ